MNQLKKPETPPAELWRRITAMPRPSDVVDFPRKDDAGKPVGQVRLRALTQGEITMCAANARRKTTIALKEQANAPGVKLRADEEVFDNFNSAEVLYAACIDVDDPEQAKRLFPSPGHILDNLSTDEIGQLAVAYMYMMADISPTADSIGSDEDLEAFLDKLAQGGKSTPLAGYTLQALSRALLFTAKRLRSLQMDNSSPISPPDSMESTSASA